MFTGLIEDIGTLKQLRTRDDYRVLGIESRIAEELKVGESVSCDGACLTVTALKGRIFEVEASPETERKTIVGYYRRGTRINLERAVRVGDRLGGHIVSGHVDSTGTVSLARKTGESRELGITFDSSYDDLVIEKGSVAINGVSLTVNRVKSGWLSVNIIPHTAAMTTLGEIVNADKVNIEFDLLGKYVLRILSKNHNSGLTVDKLRESGW